MSRFAALVILENSRSTHWNRQESFIAPHRVEVTFPSHLAAKLLDLSLLAQPKKGFQTKFDNLPLRAEAGRTQGVCHEFVVNHNIRSHDVHGSLNTYTLYVSLAAAT